MVSVGITLQLPDAVLEAVLDALLATELAAELLVLDAALDVLFALEPFEPPPPQLIKPVAPKTLTAPSVPRALRRVISIPWSAELFICFIVRTFSKKSSVMDACLAMTTEKKISF